MDQGDRARTVERGERLLEVRLGRRNGRDQERLRPPAERVLQQSSELGLAVRHVRTAVDEAIDDAAAARSAGPNGGPTHSVSSEALIMPASRARPSRAPLLPTDSEPARSTRLSLAVRSMSSPPPPTCWVSRMWTVMVKMACDRLDWSLHRVAATSAQHNSASTHRRSGDAATRASGRECPPRPS